MTEGATIGSGFRLKWERENEQNHGEYRKSLHLSPWGGSRDKEEQKKKGEGKEEDSRSGGARDTLGHFEEAVGGILRPSQ